MSSPFCRRPARPEWLSHDPEIFYGFWGTCSGASPPRPTFEGTLAGEHVVEQVKSCSLLVQNPFCEVAGRLQMTPYRLKFMIPKGSLRKELQWMREAKYFDVPFGALES
ncbi:unnamed protein product [Symbiodinium sp. KB8]|nr:unnamed protein product [Symbiodinium sp. KB8]